MLLHVFRRGVVGLSQACGALSLVLVASSAQAITASTASSSFAQLSGFSNVVGNGILIAPNWVLTAKHVANGMMVGSTQYSSSFVDAIYTPNPSAVFPEDDIALIHLSSSLSAPTPVLNSKTYTPFQASAGMIGPVTLAAIGSLSGHQYADATVSGLLPTNDGVTTNYIVTDGPSYVQGGDSGSALFKGDVTDGAGQVLLGVASAQLDNRDGTFGSGFVEPVRYRSWIDSTMAASGQSAVWGTTAVTPAVPEPSSWALMMAGALALVAFVRAKAMKPVQLQSVCVSSR